MTTPDSPTMLLQALSGVAGSVDWDKLAAFLAGSVSAIVGAVVKGVLDDRGFKREIVRREAERVRDIAERSQLAALRLITTLDGFAQSAAEWHANFEDEDDPYGGRVSDIPELTWPLELAWDALGLPSSNEAFAFQVEVERRRQRLASAFQFDGDVGMQLVPDELLEVAADAIALTDHIRKAHQIPRPKVIRMNGWDWRAYIRSEMHRREEEKKLRLARAADRRAKRTKSSAPRDLSK